jgi:hypothetical protein
VASTWTEYIKQARTGERMWVDGDLALQNFKTWLQTVSGLPDYDHAMSFTGYVFSVLLFKFIYTHMNFFLLLQIL